MMTSPLFTPGLACCEALSSILGSKVSFPGSPNYNASVNSYFTQQAATVHPDCIASLQSSKDVSTAIRSLRKPSVTALSPDEGGCQFAIRAGGHGTLPGASNIPGGVVLDLRALDDLVISKDAATVSVGTGAVWDTVYEYLDNLGLSVAGGRASGVGVGGLTLGGGISYFGPRYGWTCDSVTGLEIVLADGSIIEANPRENKDLFFSLHGGGNNFGVVTRVDLETFQQGPVWSAMLYHPLSTIEDQIETFLNNTAAASYDDNASFLTTFGYVGSQGLAAVANNLIYTRPENSTPAVYQRLFDLPTLLKSVATTNVSALARLTGELQESGDRRLYTALTLRPTRDMLSSLYGLWNQSIDSIRDIKGVVWSVNLDPVPPTMYARKGKSNALGLADRHGTLIVTQLAATWTDAADDDKVIREAQTFLAAVEDKARNLNAYDPFIYANYAAGWQDPITSYGNVSLQKLRRARSEVDPRGIFTRNVPGGFKISY